MMYFPKIESKKDPKDIICNHCKDTGVEYYFELDGMTIYSWQKPLQRKCSHCQCHHIRKML